MKHILITGTNGMIGRLVLDICLQRTDVASVTSITRKPIGITDPRLTEMIHEDFLNFSPIAAHFANQDICFFCVGVYTGAVPREEFRKITVAITKTFAETVKAQSPDTRFCFLSGQGADRSEKSNIMFALDKGVAENSLIGLNFKNLFIFRPGYIYPVTARTEPNTLYRIMRALYKPVLSRIYPNIGLTSAQLAQAMVKAGFESSGLVTFENRDIRRLSS